MKSSQPDRGALLLMALTVLIWGFNWIVMKHLSHYIGPFDLVLMRYGFAFPVLFAMLLVSRKSLRFPPFWLTVIIALFQTTAFQCFSQLALISGGAGHVVMLAYTMPFWVVFFAWLLLGARPTRRHVIGFVCAGLGLFAVIAPWQGLGTITGSAFAVAGGACWGLGTVFSQMMFQRHTPDLLNFTAWQMALGALFTLPLVWVFPQPAIVWRPDLVLGMAYMSLLASALAWGLWLLVVRRVNATIAGMSSLGVPVLTVILAWLILAERPTGFELVGIVLMMAGLVVVNWPSSKSRTA